MCDSRLMVGIEKIALNYSLLDYEWGKLQSLNLYGVFIVKYVTCCTLHVSKYYVLISEYFSLSQFEIQTNQFVSFDRYVFLKCLFFKSGLLNQNKLFYEFSQVMGYQSMMCSVMHSDILLTCYWTK